MSRSTVVMEILLFGALSINHPIAQTYTTGFNRGRWAAHTGIVNHANDVSNTMSKKGAGE